MVDDCKNVTSDIIYEIEILVKCILVLYFYAMSVKTLIIIIYLADKKSLTKDIQCIETYDL